MSDKIVDLDAERNARNTETVQTNDWTIRMDEPSAWRCILTGDTIYQPRKGCEPNRFHRWMHRLAFGFRWEKNK